MNPPVDESVAALAGLLSFVLIVAMYVWTALALSAMFRKMGEEPWKGWVPLLNIATVLKWGGFSPWLVLLVLFPGLGAVAVWVLLVISAHRINPGFGYGAGMTVLAALLFVVWASILGFGPARWLGARTAGRAPQSAGAAPAPSAPSGPPAARAVPLEAAPPATLAPAALPHESVPGPLAPTLDESAAASFAPPVIGDASWTPPETSPRPAPAAPSPAHPVSAVPVAVTAPVASTPSAAPPAPAVPAARSGASDSSDLDVAATDAEWPSEVDDVSAIHPSPFPPSAASGRAYVGSPVGEDDGPIAFVPGRRTGQAPAPAATPVERVPAATAPEPQADPEPPRRAAPAPAAAIFAQPAPARRTFDVDDPDAFPELSGEVSAVVGSPTAGTPRSAVGAVSAQHRRAEWGGRDGDERVGAVVDDGRADDDLDETVIVRRAARPTWELVPATGSPIPLTATVVILGRRPAGDAAFPAAQLVAVHDDARTVSKTHARIEQHGEGWTVTDLASTNGVLVRTLMGDEVELEPGGQLDAGERFFLGDEEFHLRRITS